MSEDITERRLFATYEQYGEFSNAQASFLLLDLDTEPTVFEDKNEIGLLRKLSEILDEYQEQSYLLDPFLEKLVVPVADCLKAHAKSAVSDRAKRVSTARVGRVAALLYSYIKCRGYKTIIRFFPHEIADLSIALGYMLIPDGPAQDPANWSLRYVVLLWLSLVCMLPFDLAQFDEDDRVGNTAALLDSLATGFLGKAGLEREGAVALLSRLYTRKDTLSRFQPFLEWSSDLLDGTPDAFTSIGILQVICEVVKLGSTDQIQANIARISSIGDAIGKNSALSKNTVVRKFKTKLVSRVALRRLPTKPSAPRHKARTLTGTMPMNESAPEVGDIDVPEEVEVALEELFQTLRDKDTIVRWSASKGVARISERLPTDFADQVFDTVTSLFSVHSIAAASIYDMPAIAESTWHGACLACAEMARRGLVARAKLPELIGWLSKALYFDIRKGAHSIGSNVRDAAAYVLWALARAQDTPALAPHTDHLAGSLITVALYDREIHVRRAASATFQEHVGRMNLFPHGIDIMRKTDFYSVSVRRNAFLIAAPQIAEHVEYRIFLFDHILNVTLRHWDPTMRELGAQSLRRICSVELPVLGPEATRKAAQLFHSLDTTDIHGGLLALVEIAAAYRDFEERDILEMKLRDIFRYLADIPSTILQSARNELVIAAACNLIASSITQTEITLGSNSSVPQWRKLVDRGLKHTSTKVQEAAAAAMAAVSKIVDCSSVVTRLIPELKAGSPMMQQSLGRFLGVLDYATHPHGFSEAIGCLLECVNGSSPKKLYNVEARRNCYLAMPRILHTMAPQLTRYVTPSVVQSLFDALQDGLKDYTVDERGDVGSWIRIACIEGLTSCSEIIFSHSGDIPNFEEYLPPSSYHDSIGGILKQGVERLDGVRQEAGDKFRRILLLPVPQAKSADAWRIEGYTLMKELFLSETTGWNDSSWLFPRAVQLLEVGRYRKQILAGLVLSIDSKTDSTQRFAASSLVTYTNSLPVNNSAYNLTSLVQDLIDHVKLHLHSNAVVVPVLRTFNALFEADALERLLQNTDGSRSLQFLFAITSKNVSQLKSIHRIVESMKILVNLLSGDVYFDRCVSALVNFLAHQLPKIRTDTAEYMYNMLQIKELGCDTDNIEEILLETEWSSSDIQVAKDSAFRMANAFLAAKRAAS